MLPLVEFYLEDDITDEEAQNLLDMAPPRDDKRNRDSQWREDRMGSILVWAWSGLRPITNWCSIVNVSFFAGIFCGPYL